MSLIENGLPASFFTRWRAVATGLFIAGAFIVGSQTYAKLSYYLGEPSSAPPCYGELRHEAGTQMIPPRGAQDRSGRNSE